MYISVPITKSSTRDCASYRHKKNSYKFLLLETIIVYLQIKFNMPFHDLYLIPIQSSCTTVSVWLLSLHINVSYLKLNCLVLRDKSLSMLCQALRQYLFPLLHSLANISIMQCGIRTGYI